MYFERPSRVHTHHFVKKKSSSHKRVSVPSPRQFPDRIMFMSMLTDIELIGTEERRIDNAREVTSVITDFKTKVLVLRWDWL